MWDDLGYWLDDLGDTDLSELFPLDDIAGGWDIESVMQDFYPLDDIASGWDLGGAGGLEGLRLDPGLLTPLAKIALPSGPGAGAPGSGMAANPFAPSFLSSLLKLVGGAPGAMSMAGVIGGGINQNNATKDAQARMDGAVTQANETVRGILGGAGDGYKPYSQAGESAVQKLAGMEPSNLAGNFAPIGQPSNLAATRRPIGQPSQLADRYRPLGSGAALSMLGKLGGKG